MNTMERLAAIGRHYGVATAYPEHQILDHLDKKAGIDTKGGTVDRTHYTCHATGAIRRHPINYIGTRIRLHEEHISKTRLSFTFWLGEEGSRIGEVFYMNLTGYSVAKPSPRATEGYKA